MALKIMAKWALRCLPPYGTHIVIGSTFLQQPASVKFMAWSNRGSDPQQGGAELPCPFPLVKG